LVNRICKLALKAGETNNLSQIDVHIIQQIGERFARTSSLPQKSAGTAEFDIPDNSSPEMRAEIVKNSEPEPEVSVVDNVPKQQAVTSPKRSHQKLIREMKKEFTDDKSPLKDLLDRMKDRHRSMRNTNMFFR